MSQEAILKMTVEIPRSTMLKLTNRFKGDLAEVVRQAVESAAGPDDGAVRVSGETILKACSLLNVGAINSERALVEAIQARLKVQPGSILMNLDPNVTQAMEEVARSNGISLAEAAKNFFELAIANGWFETTWDLRSLLFTPAQWKQLKSSLGNLPSDAYTVTKVLSDWAEMQQAAKTPGQGVEVPMPTPDSHPDSQPESLPSEVPHF